MAEQPGTRETRRELLDLLERLHRHKDAAYGDAWRKRGEVIAIFANLARKYDRLLVAFDEARPAASESLSDTVGDLCVYAAKYLTWLAEVRPESFAKAGLTLRADQVGADIGPDAVATVLATLADCPHRGNADPNRVWHDVKTTFTELEYGLMAQATPGSLTDERLDWPEKAMLAWTLADQSAELLASLAADDPAVLNLLRAEVSSMDDVGGE